MLGKSYGHFLFSLRLNMSGKVFLVHIDCTVQLQTLNKYLNNDTIDTGLNLLRNAEMYAHTVTLKHMGPGESLLCAAGWVPIHSPACLITIRAEAHISQWEGPADCTTASLIVAHSNTG